ncbi:MAG: leucyl/phenylalanyl-tRNA--protein transferase [Gammaproteobacteria bacterium]|nr:leucyl/phenylalanyl-tRNA--protein transferase [Gammaproteobacteria bacterium]
MTNPPLTWLEPNDPPDAFPPVETAFVEPDGLLAAGGDLSPQRLLYAYRNGIFPWYDEGQPILWWSPDPRCVMLPGKFHASRRLLRALRNATFEVTFNTAFDRVIRACAGDRPGQRGTWITAEMRHAYRELHRSGWAHSIEIWDEDRLAGGLYGIGIGKAFFGESMFSRSSNGSKAAMLVLTRLLREQQFDILDCQVVSPHLLTLGAGLMPRRTFTDLLESACADAEQCRFWPTRKLPIGHFLSF